MRKETDAGVGGCNGVQTRPRRLLPRFSLRRLLYSSPLIGRRITRTPSASNRNKAKDATSTRVTDVEKGEARVSNGSSHFQFHNLDLQRTSSKGSVLPTAGKSNEHGLMECPLCLAELPSELFPIVQSCHHRSCYDCFQQYLKVEISESRVNIACPECSEPLHPNDIRMILNDQVQLEKYEDFMVRRVLAVEPDARWCPAPDCSFAVIASGCASCPKLRCERPGCDSYFCYHCKARWHPNQTCDAARAQRSQYYERSSSLSFSQSDSQHRDDIKPCPRCQVLIVKMDDGSCNHMTCAVCGAEFCWLCMKEISDLHYLSPSGCTFWGKKPWSRKKKILWQLGTLVGAPVGIGLVAGIAVPAMIIGIPVWVGRKIYTRYEKANKHKRNAFIAGGVTASVLVSPVLAGLAVGIGVPILLFYVYGVVPVSLCRSGGCGVSTNGSGVRFEFDDENELMGALGVRNAGDAASIDVASHRGGNPSIGEASLSLGSGSQLEKLGRENDRESASNVALAGTSLAGSIASSVLPGGQRLEVQADVTSTQRFSLCSETASAATSLSEKSVNASIALDDGAASTRALAGSVLNFKVDSGSTGGGRSTEGEQTIGSTGGGHMDSAGQAASLSSLEEIAPGLAKRTRRRPTLDRQPSDSSSWTVCGEDGGSERVRFDDHVSFIEADQEAGLGTCAVNNRGPGRRKRNKELEQDGEVPKSSRCSNSELNAAEANAVLDIDDEPRERVNVATLRSVFFHNPAACSDREIRLPVIVEPSVSQAQTSIEQIRLPVWEKFAENVSRENSAHVRLPKKNMTSSRITTESIKMTHMRTPSTVEAPIIKMPHELDFKSSSIDSPVIKLPHEWESKSSSIDSPVIKLPHEWDFKSSSIDSPVIKLPHEWESKSSSIDSPVIKLPHEWESKSSSIDSPVIKLPHEWDFESSSIDSPVIKLPHEWESKSSSIDSPVIKLPHEWESKSSSIDSPVIKLPHEWDFESSSIDSPVIKLPHEWDFESSSIDSPVIKLRHEFVSEIKPVARPVLTPHELDFKLSTIEKPIIKLAHHPTAPPL